LEQRVAERTADLKSANRRLVRFSQVVEQNPVGILIARIGGTVEFVNPAYSRITGRNPDDLIEQPLIEVMRTADPLDADNALRVAAAGSIWEIEQPSRRGDSAYWERLAPGRGARRKRAPDPSAACPAKTSPSSARRWKRSPIRRTTTCSPGCLTGCWRMTA
jgi:PAS domain S-box-containing protein